MKKKIIYRAEGNSTTGLGHLYRLFALVEMLKNDYEFIFVTKENSAVNVIPKQYPIQCIPNTISIDDEPQWLANHFKHNAYFIIADGYQFIASYQKNLKKIGFQLVYVDDINQWDMFADIVINHAPAINSTYRTQTYTKLALGTQYALLRPGFLKEARNKPKFKQFNTAFVCFGGSDLYDLSFIAVQALLEITIFTTIYVVVGAAYKGTKIMDLANHYPRIKIVKNASENALLEIMKNSNFAIAPASTILYELCCVKMPILSGYYVENQKNIYKQLVKNEVVFEGGNFSNYSKSDFITKINDVILNEKIKTQLEQQYQLFDGKNKTRILGLINSLFIDFERASLNHLDLTYEWSNDVLVRKNSYQSDTIEYQDHINWYNAKIKDKNTLFLIVLVNNRPAGVVRYDCKSDFAVVGILVSKAFRGQGLASQILIKSSKLYFSKFDLPIFAYIKTTNTASVKTFKKAHYRYLKKDTINNTTSFVYKLEKDDIK